MTRQFANAVSTTLTASMTNVQTTMQVSSATGFPVTFPFDAHIEAEGANADEIVSVTSLSSGTTYNVTRASEPYGGSAAAAAHGIGANLRLVGPTAGALSELAVRSTFVRNYSTIQAAIDAAGTNGVVVFDPLNYSINATLKFYNGQRWIGAGEPYGFGTAGTKLTWAGGAGSMVTSQNPAVNYVNVEMRNIWLHGGFGLATTCLDLTNVSYSHFVGVLCSDSSANGFLLNTTGGLQCYFNLFEGCLSSVGGAGGHGYHLSNGANANVFVDCRGGGDGITVYLTSLSEVNTFVGLESENDTVGVVYVDSGYNKFITAHMEAAPYGFSFSANGVGTLIEGFSYATLTNPFVGLNLIAGDNPRAVLPVMIGLGSAQVIVGTGTPLGVVVANIGSIFLRTDGGAATTLYVKESGNNASTGWVTAGSLTNSSGVLGADVALAVNTTTTILSPTLAVGTWLLTYDAVFTTTSAAVNFALLVASGTATATFGGATEADKTIGNTFVSESASLAVIVTVTGAGTVLLSARADALTTTVKKLGTQSQPATGYTAVKIA